MTPTDVLSTFLCLLVLLGCSYAFAWWLWRLLMERDASGSGDGSSEPADLSAAGLVGEETLSAAGLEYWGGRFEMLRVGELAGCTFEQYLQRPYYFERVARARREARRRRVALRRSPRRYEA